MAKSKAQRMREYRERKKEQLGEKWLKSERERVKGYHVPIADLDSEKRQKKREGNKRRQALYRLRKKEKNAAHDSNNQSEVRTESPIASTSNTSENLVPSTSSCNLTVKLPFCTSNIRKSIGKRRVSRALAKSYKTINTLEEQNSELKKKLKTAQKMIQRHNKKDHSNTPRGKTDALLKKSGIHPKQVPDIRKRLIYAECLSEEIKFAQQDQGKNCKKKETVHRVASGKIIRKYRLKTTLEKMTNLNRRKACNNKSLAYVKKSRLRNLRKQVSEEVVTFLERDDNSRLLPGKNDAVTSCKERIQKRVLNDYMYNLHLKFQGESTLSVSRAAFYRCRPKHIALVNFASRSICLCSKHQNFCFLLRTLKSLNVSSCTNPDQFVEKYKDDIGSLLTLLQKIPEGSEVRYQQWRRVKLNNGKERQRVVEVMKERDEFVKEMTEAFKEFRGHIQRVKEQYKAIKMLKDRLPSNQVVIQMDFSENYSCNTLEEIQSAYWNACMVTLHPVVMYYRKQDGEQLRHSSYVYVSEVLSHNAAMVISIIDKVIAEVKQLIPNVNTVHFFTDSPSSQYRNKTIFDLVSRFPQRYGISASWMYFESGHGKSPCDGVGGTTKRNADNAVKQGKVLIQDASDFFAWATQNEKGIQYVFVTQEEYDLNKTEVDKRNTEIKPLKGSMLIHAVVGINDGSLGTRETTCVCDACFDGSSFRVNSACGWNVCTISSKVVRNVASDTQNEKNQHESHCTDTEKETETEKQTEEQSTEATKESRDISDLAVNRFVVARYSFDQKCYIGKVIEIEHDDNTVHISFMSKCGKLKGLLKWPLAEDTVWVKTEDVMWVIDDPTPTSKTGRMYSVPEDILKMLH